MRRTSPPPPSYPTGSATAECSRAFRSNTECRSGSQGSPCPPSGGKCTGQKDRCCQERSTIATDLLRSFGSLQLLLRLVQRQRAALQVVNGGLHAVERLAGAQCETA